MAIQVSNRQWQAPSLGYSEQDVYMDASGNLRVAAGAKPGFSRNRVTLLTGGDGNLIAPNAREEGLSPEDKKRKKVQNKLGGDLPSSAQIDYSMTRQSTLLGG